MVDRVYRSDLPRLRKELQILRKESLKIEPSTDWVSLRIDPLIAHVDVLRRRIRTWDSAGTRGAVPMLHSDLVYFRKNVKSLREVLAAERRFVRARRRQS